MEQEGADALVSSVQLPDEHGAANEGPPQAPEAAQDGMLHANDQVPPPPPQVVEERGERGRPSAGRGEGVGSAAAGVSSRTRRPRGEVNLCICEHRQMAINAPQQYRRRKPNTYDEVGESAFVARCREEEAKYAPGFFLRGMMIRLPNTDERSERYGGVSRRQRWLQQLGITEEEIAHVKQPYVRWTHFPLKCFNDGGGKEVKRRRILKIVGKDEDTDPADVIPTGEFKGKAIATPSMRFQEGGDAGGGQGQLRQQQGTRGAGDLGSGGENVPMNAGLTDGPHSVIRGADAVAQTLQHVTKDPRAAAIQLVASQSKEAGLENSLAEMRERLEAERADKHRLEEQLIQLRVERNKQDTRIASMEAQLERIKEDAKTMREELAEKSGVPGVPGRKRAPDLARAKRVRAKRSRLEDGVEGDHSDLEGESVSDGGLQEEPPQTEPQPFV